MELASKVVEIIWKIIISLSWSKSVELTEVVILRANEARVTWLSLNQTFKSSQVSFAQIHDTHCCNKWINIRHLLWKIFNLFSLFFACKKIDILLGLKRDINQFCFSILFSSFFRDGIFMSKISTSSYKQEFLSTKLNRWTNVEIQTGYLGWRYIGQ